LLRWNLSSRGFRRGQTAWEEGLRTFVDLIHLFPLCGPYLPSRSTNATRLERIQLSRIKRRVTGVCSHLGGSLRVTFHATGGNALWGRIMLVSSSQLRTGQSGGISLKWICCVGFVVVVV
jgi:hypothetical protein